MSGNRTTGVHVRDRKWARHRQWHCLGCWKRSEVDPDDPGDCPHCGSEFWSPVERDRPPLPPSYYEGRSPDDLHLCIRRDGGGWRWMIVQDSDGAMVAKGQPWGMMDMAEEDAERFLRLLRDDRLHVEADHNHNNVNGGEAMGALVQRDRAVKSLREMFDRSKGQIQAALPKHMNSEFMLRVAMTSVQINPELLECDPKSVLSAVIQCAQLGLAPDGVLGEAYLVPYRQKGGQARCQLIPGYKGLCELVRRSGYVTKIYARVVREGDLYEFEEGLTPVLKHKPAPQKDQGDMIAVYAVAHFRDGTAPQYVWMWRSDIEAHRNKFSKSRGGPWSDHFEAMAKKTVIRQLCNELPKSREMQTALDIDDNPGLQTWDAPVAGHTVEHYDAPPLEHEQPEPAPTTNTQDGETVEDLHPVLDDYASRLVECSAIRECNAIKAESVEDDRLDESAQQTVATAADARAQEIRNSRGERSNSN